jgi:hypothetical protein
MVYFKVREAHVLQDLQRKLKKDKAEYEAAIQALKVKNIIFIYLSVKFLFTFHATIDFGHSKTMLE